MTIAITRQLQIDLAIYTLGVERARREYAAKVHRVCPVCERRRLDGGHYTCHHCRKSKP